MHIVGIIGPIGAGKDTIAEYLINNCAYKKLSFASRVKDVAAVAFGWNRTMLEGDTPASRQWRETKDTFWETTPRYALQRIGTEMFRAHIRDDFWIRIVEQQIQQAKEAGVKGVVITDCRFENEIRMLQRLGGKILHVHREAPPVWAKQAMEGNPFDTSLGIHITDWNAWAFYNEAEIYVENTTDLSSLHTELDSIFNDGV